MNNGLRPRLLRSYLKLGIPCALVVVLLCWMMLRTTRQAIDVAAQSGPSVRALLLTRIGVEHSQNAIKRYVVEPTQDLEDAWKRAWDVEIADALESVEEVAASWPSEEKDLLVRIRATLSRLRGIHWWIADVARSPGCMPLRLAIEHELQPHVDEMYAAITAVINIEKQLPGDGRRDLLSAMADFRGFATHISLRSLSYLDREGSGELAALKKDVELCRDRLAVLGAERDRLEPDQRDLIEWLIGRFELIRRDTARIERTRTGSGNVAQDVVLAEAVPLADGAIELLSELTAGRNRRLAVSSQRVVRNGNAALLLSGLALVVIFLFAPVTAKRQSAAIATPVNRLAERIEAFRDGRDVGEPASTDIHEIRRLNLAFGEMRRTIESNRQSMESANAELEDAIVRANAANQTKSEFLANMSHEIRTPMTAILGFAETLAESVDDAQDKEAVSVIRRNGELLLDIINGILDLSKIESGKMLLERKRCSPARIVAETESLMRVRADAKGLHLNVTYATPVPEWICSDPTRLKQILINLVGNAIKFTELGSVQIAVRHEPRPAGSMIHFEILDTGIGIAEAQMEHLFEPFSQADGSMTRRYGGTGLGLAISRRFAELMGGGIIVDSTPGEGSCFRLSIPTGDPAAVRMLTDPRSEVFVENSETLPGEVRLDDCRILLAEDGPDNQRLIAHVLRKAGADVRVVENGRDALDAAMDVMTGDRPFDAILMDMQMPVLDGYQATRRLRERGYDMPVIALTAHAMAGDRESCIDAGCDDYVTKPIDRAQLIACLRKHISRAQSLAH